MRLLPIVIATLLAAAPAVAQQNFELDDTDRWTEIESADPGSPAGQIDAIRRALAEEQWERAENLATRWIERHEGHPLLAEAYLVRGDSQRGRRNYYEALFDYEYVARGFPGSEAFVTALQRELEIARLFAHGTKRKLWGLRIVDATEEAEELFIRIQERMPGSTVAEEAGLELADFYFRRRDMVLAAEAYGLFIENYPRSEHLSVARRRLVFAHLASFKGPEFDAAGLFEARARLEELIVAEPITAQQLGARALLRRIDDSDARKQLVTARWYVRIGDAISAEFTIRELLEEYPRTPAARDAVRLALTLLPSLPPSVRAAAPDYAAYQAAFEEAARVSEDDAEIGIEEPTP
jgi:outer membrane protein assembly factor BamD